MSCSTPLVSSWLQTRVEDLMTIGVDVCVVGSLNADLVVRVPRRPTPGETVLGSSFETALGGKGFNQAVAAARSGATVAMVGWVGDDQYGGELLAALETDAIDAT